MCINCKHFFAALVTMSTCSRKRSARTSLAANTSCKRRKDRDSRRSAAPSGFSALPKDCMQHCLSFLDERDQCRVSQVNARVQSTCKSSKHFLALMALVRAAYSKTVVDPSKWVRALDLPAGRGERALPLLSSALALAAVAAHTNLISDPGAKERAAMVRRVVCEHLERRPHLKKRFFTFKKGVLCTNIDNWTNKTQFKGVVKFLFGGKNLLKLAHAAFESENELLSSLLRSTHRKVYDKALWCHAQKNGLSDHEVYHLDRKIMQISVHREVRELYSSNQK